MAEMKRLFVRLLYHDTSVMREVGLVMCNHVVPHLDAVKSDASDWRD